MNSNYTLSDNEIMIKNLPKIIFNNTHDHEVFFVTTTYKDLPYEPHKNLYLQTNKALYQKINQYTLNRQIRNPELKIKMIWMPEYSYKKSTKPNNTKKLFRPMHGHAFLLIKNKYRVKFVQKCLDRSDRPSKNFKNIYCFKEKLISQNRQPLKGYDSDVIALYDDEEIYSVASYMTKRIEKADDANCKFELSSILNGNYSSDSDDERLSAENIMFFCDISGFQRLNKNRCLAEKKIE